METRKNKIVVKGIINFSFGKNGQGLSNELIEIGTLIKQLSEDNHIHLIESSIDAVDDVYDLKFKIIPREENSYMIENYKEKSEKEQRSAEWTEEEIIMKGEITNLLQKSGHYEKESAWLKSLKPQSHWKPSDEQLEALKDAIRIKPFENPSNNLLWELYEQLKKLIGG